MLEECAATVGLERLGSLHLNDSQTPLGSNRDRHANVGEGEIGDGGLRGVPLRIRASRACRACSRRPARTTAARRARRSRSRGRCASAASRHGDGAASLACGSRETAR